MLNPHEHFVEHACTDVYSAVVTLAVILGNTMWAGVPEELAKCWGISTASG